MNSGQVAGEQGGEMGEDFTASAERHWKDAELLDEEQRWENADHHYGFAAECALKSALQAMGAFREDHRKHINVLWNKMQATAFQRRFPGLTRLLAGSNRFADWDVEQRYEADGAVNEDTIRAHRESARRLLIAANLYRG
jgi:HEPN domain-containing protein